MAVPAGTFQTYQAIGNREDLMDVIFDISPTDTPFTTNAKRDRANATYVEWQIDALAAATANAHVEGDDSAANTATPTSRIGNQTQILKKVPQVTRTQRSVNSAGRRDEMNLQVQKRMKEIKRDLEKAVTGTVAATSGATNAARTMAGIACWLFDNQVALGAAAVTPTVTSGYPSASPTAGTDTALTEAHLKSAIGLAWDNGGDPSVVMVGRQDKQAISAFTGIATQYRDNQGQGPAVIIGAADVYVSDFGTHYIVANRFQPADNVYVLDFEYLCLSFLDNFSMEPLAKTGDSDKVQIVGEVTLKVESPKAHAKIYTTTG